MRMERGLFFRGQHITFCFGCTNGNKQGMGKGEAARSTLTLTKGKSRILLKIESCKAHPQGRRHTVGELGKTSSYESNRQNRKGHSTAVDCDTEESNTKKVKLDEIQILQPTLFRSALCVAS